MNYSARLSNSVYTVETILEPALNLQKVNRQIVVEDLGRVSLQKKDCSHLFHGTIPKENKKFHVRLGNSKDVS